MITVNTGLDGFVFPDAILKISDHRVLASVSYQQKYKHSHMTGFMGLEALAQTAAMHVRHLCNFEKHAFLLKVEEFDEEQALIPGVDHEIEGQLAGKTDAAFSYRLFMKRGEGGGVSVNRARLIIAVKPYDDLFKREALEAYYKERFKRLTMD